MSVCAIQNLAGLQTALMGAQNALEAGKALLTNPFQFDDEGLRLASHLRSAIAAVNGSAGQQFALSPTARQKSEVVYRLGEDWEGVRKNLAFLFGATAEVSRMAREKLRARAQKRDIAKNGESLAALISGLNFADRDSGKPPLTPAEVTEAIAFARSMKALQFNSETWPVFALGFYQNEQMAIIFGRPVNPWKTMHREAAQLAETLLLTNILKQADREFAADFLMVMEPKTPADFFSHLADVLADTHQQSSQLIAHHARRKDWETWDKDQAQLASFGDMVKAIRLVLREADRIYPEEAELFYSRLRALNYSRSTELMDTISRRAQLARTAPSRQPQIQLQPQPAVVAEPVPELPPSA